jgi:hypothetical protein
LTDFVIVAEWGDGLGRAEADMDQETGPLACNAGAAGMASLSRSPMTALDFIQHLGCSPACMTVRPLDAQLDMAYVNTYCTSSAEGYEHDDPYSKRSPRQPVPPY